MNRKNMLKVADFVERENYRFDMRTWVDTVGDRTVEEAFKSAITEGDFCGTAACVSGTANLIESRERYLAGTKKARPKIWRDYWTTSTYDSTVWLGLDDYDASELFYGGALTMNHINRNRKLVPDALRYMAATDDVNWKRAFAAARQVARCRAEREIDVAERSIEVGA